MVIHDWLEGVIFTVHWGWFSLLTLIEYLIFAIFGILGGLCVALLAEKEKAFFWSGVTGITMILTYATHIKIAFLSETTFSQYAAIYMRPVMFFTGALLGSFALNKTKEKILK
ncbi:MAG TPA: hypothetical protein DCX54_08030 [Flavobacteriales bacterium]|nr:hypothetical protein [Flavobacteriales bacterium]